MDFEEYDKISPEDIAAFKEEVKALEHNIVFPRVVVAVKEGEKALKAVNNNNKKPVGKGLDYGSFINEMLNNPTVTKEDRGRIVKLLLKERDKGFVTKEQVEQMIQKYIGSKSDVIEGIPTTTFYHNPKAMVSFLYQFSVNDTFKWFTHEPDPDFDFDYEVRVLDAATGYNSISKGVNGSTWNNVKNFVLNTDEPAKDYYNKDIKFRWKDMARWCFEHKHEHPYNALIDNYTFARYIEIFKNTIEFRNVPKFSVRFEDFIYDEALKNTDVNPVFTENFYIVGGQLRVYVDVRQLFSAIKEICKWILENKSKGNVVEFSVEEKNDSYVLSIFHLNSYLTINAEKIKGLSGDFHKVRNMLLNVADWTMDADVSNKQLRIICLNNATKYTNNKVVSENTILELPEKVNGIKHMITLYKNIQ